MGWFPLSRRGNSRLALHPSYSTVESRMSVCSNESDTRNMSNQIQWCGHFPCVDAAHRGCEEHNPGGEPLFRNPHLPPIIQPTRFQRVCGILLRSPQSTTPLLETLPPEFVIKSDSLPLYQGSTQTLTPIHNSMPYHLAYYHLHCALKDLSGKDNIDTIKITSLSCNGESDFGTNGAWLDWSSEVYYDKGTFLKKEEVLFFLDKKTPAPDIWLNTCPHRRICIKAPVFGIMDGFTHARVQMVHSPQEPWKPRRRPPYSMSADDAIWPRHWDSHLGIYWESAPCLSCYTDADTTMEVIGDELQVRHICYKDLGSGREHTDIKWRATLPGSSHCPLKDRSAKSVSLCLRVREVAEALERGQTSSDDVTDSGFEDLWAASQASEELDQKLDE